jgi:hypothetical protein
MQAKFAIFSGDWFDGKGHPAVVGTFIAGQ